MYRAFKMMVNNNIRDVEIYNHNGSMWGIFTEKKQWVFEFTKQGTLWYNYRFFTEILNFFSMTAEDGKDLITKWFEETYLKINQVKHTLEISNHRMRDDVEETIQNGVKGSTSLSASRKPQVEQTIQNGVKDANWRTVENYPEFEERVIRNGVKETKFNQTEQERKYNEIFGGKI